jgi:hypothetical protein
MHVYISFTGNHQYSPCLVPAIYVTSIFLNLHYVLAYDIYSFPMLGNFTLLHQMIPLSMYNLSHITCMYVVFLQFNLSTHLTQAPLLVIFLL